MELILPWLFNFPVSKSKTLELVSSAAFLLDLAWNLPASTSYMAYVAREFGYWFISAN